MKTKRLYKIIYSKIGCSGHKVNSSCNVVAMDIKKAIETCESKVPGCTVWNITHLGSIDHIDPENAEIADQN